MEELRKSSEQSRSDLAKRVGLAARDIASFERGERVPTPAELEALARGLGGSTDDLTGGEPPESMDIRIDDILDEPDPVDEALADLSSSARRKERRRLPRARTKLERAFVDVATQLDEVIDCAARIATAAPTDDLTTLLRELEEALTRARDSADVARALARHDEALQRASAAEKEARAASWRSRRSRRDER